MQRPLFWTLVFVLFVLYSVGPCNAQISEPPLGNRSHQEYIAMLKDSLSFAQKRTDTINIIRHSAVLTTQLQSISNEEAASYLQLAFRFARAHRDPKWYADVCNRAGMLMLSYAGDPVSLKKLKRTNSQMYDSSLYWHRQAVRKGLAIGRNGTAGWGYRGLIYAAMSHQQKTIQDSIPFYYNRAVVMAEFTGDRELAISSSTAYARCLKEKGEAVKINSAFEKIATQQLDQTWKNNLTQESHIAGLINNLTESEANRDTVKIIQHALDLTQSFRLMLMNDRAIHYLHIARHYAESFSDPKPLIDVYYFSGVVMTAFGKVDSARYYHLNVIKKGPLVGYPDKVGWAYKQLMANAVNAPTAHPVKDSILFYYKKAKEYLGVQPQLRFSIDATYYLYLDQTGDLTEAGNVLRSMSSKTDQMDIGQRVGYYNSLHDHLSKTNGLDTLIKVRKQILDLFTYQTAAGHQEQLYAKDQQYEVSKTKNILNTTNGKLNAASKALIASIAALLVFALMISYLFFLFRKNKRLSQRNELLLKEQNHRVKNNLQMISSLLNLQSQKLLSTDAKDALEESKGRINSIGLLHRMLYEGETVGAIETTAYIRSLMEEIEHSSGREMNTEIDLPKRLDLKIEKVTSLGLIINELLTNSIKHVDTKIRLHVRLQLSLVDNKIHLVYSDNGSGVEPEAWMSSESFGNHLIRLQSLQLKGEFEVQIAEGFKYELKISA